jgi:hypothetical protein
MASPDCVGPAAVRVARQAGSAKLADLASSSCRKRIYFLAISLLARLIDPTEVVIYGIG